MGGAKGVAQANFGGRGVLTTYKEAYVGKLF